MQPKHRDISDRPKRPAHYLEPKDRIKNNTAWSEDRFQRKVVESEKYDKWLKESQKAAKELQEESKKEQRKVDYIHYSSLAKLIVSEYEKLYDVKWDNENNNFLKLLIDYSFSARVFGRFESNFLQSPLLVHKVLGRACRVDINKSLLIVGGYGVGKTSLLKTFDHIAKNSHILKVMDVSKKENYLSDYMGEYNYFNVHSSKEITDSYQSAKEKYLNFEMVKILTIDEILREPTVFGTETTGKDLLPEFINTRYNSRLKTHAIANYPENEMTLEGFLKAYTSRYGGYILDRVFEMYNIVELKGKSKRK